MLALMSPLFTEAQRSVAAHKKCAKSLAGVRARSDEATFRAELIKCTNCVLLVYKREPAIERLVQFLVAFVMADVPSGDEASDENSLSTFFVRAFVCFPVPRPRSPALSPCRLPARPPAAVRS